MDVGSSVMIVGQEEQKGDKWPWKKYNKKKEKLKNQYDMS